MLLTLNKPNHSTSGSFFAAAQEFGNDAHPKDLLQNGALQVAATHGEGCSDFQDLVVLSRATTVYWEAPGGDPPKLPLAAPSLVQCLRIQALAPQKEWMVILQMQIRSQ
eukprot:Skav211800  [mRNA]  locus=scaffold305:363673:365034:+ [translate_table: standard]